MQSTDTQGENITETQKRIREFIYRLGIDVKSFELSCGLSNGFVSKIGNSITTKSYDKILSAYPDLNKNWVMTGQGNMLLSDKKPRLEANPIHIASDPNDYDNDGSRFEEMGDGTLRMRVPVIPHRAYAGYLRGFQDEQFYEDLDTISIDVFKQHKGNYMAFEVMGDSMTTLEPEYFKESIFEGSIAVGRELSKHQWQYKLHTHNYDAWVIVHKTEGILIKQIISHDVENGYIRIHSLNPDKELYPDEDLFLDDIEQIFNVVQIVLRR